jgi:hypothetical protein
MEGGKKTKTIMPDIPEKVARVRSIIGSVKQIIINKTETYNDNDDVQDINILRGVLQRIKQFGISLNMILSDKTNINIKGVNDVYLYFLKNSIDLTKLSDEERSLCEYYVKLDVFMYPYSIQVGHINSQD